MPIVRNLEVTCRLLLVAAFVVAVFTKISNRRAWLAFVQSLHQLRQLPAAVVRPGLAATVTAGPVEIPYVLLAGAGGLLVGILVTAAEDIVALFRPIRTALRFTHHADPMQYVYHCHLLRHHDTRMMGQFVAVEPGESP